MNDAQKTETLKWVLTLAGVGALGFFLLPILLSMMVDAVGIALCGVTILAIYMFLPAISEVLAQQSFKLWETAIRGNPISRLWRDLAANAEEIKNMEKRISEANAQVMSLENLLKSQSKELTAEEIQEWMDSLAELKAGGMEMVNLRNNALLEYADFERQIKKAEAQYKIGNAFGSALKMFNFDKKTGQNSQGARVALDEVQKRLNESRSKLQVVLSRPQGSIGVKSLENLSVQVPTSFSTPKAKETV